MRVLLVLLVLAVLTVGATACSDDGADGAAAGTVAVTIMGIRDSVGHDVAAVMFDGLGMSAPGDRGIGGFGVEVDADPFSTTRTIATPRPIDIGTRFPYVSQEPLVVQPGEYTIMIWIAEALGPYSRWLPADSPGLGGCRVDVTVEERRPTSVTVVGIPPWTGSVAECNTQAPSVSGETNVVEGTEPAETEPGVVRDGSPVIWEIHLDDEGRGVHTVSMIADFGPVLDTDVEDTSGRLVWDQTEVALCRISIRDEAGRGRLGVGDIFQTSEGCGSNPSAMQDAFDEFGPPETACVTVSSDGTDHEFCAPLITTQ